MKKSETNTLRIEPRKVHAAAVGMAMVLIYFDYHYFVETFYWVFQPPFRIAIDTVTIVAIGLILNVVGLSEILATSRTYIVSTKGVTVIFLGIIRRLYPWQRFQSINVYPMDIGDPPWGGQPFLMVCSTVPIRTMEGGKLIWSARFFDGLIFWCFHYCRARNACNLKACGAGKYLPTWRIRNPTRVNIGER